MRDTHQVFPALGLLATFGLATHMVVQLAAQTRPDLKNAGTAEVRNGRDEVVLRGNFEAPTTQEGEIQRTATLRSTGVDADASGIAEIELSGKGATPTEVEFEVRRVDPGAAFSFVVDGAVLGTATADRRGEVEFEMDIGGGQ